MGFRFGIIQSIDPVTTLVCFIIVITFVIFFEHVTEVVEFLLEENHVYSKILQIVYKELMLMGVISFSIVMYEAAKPDTLSDQESEAIESIDFAHIVLFYMTFFFVFHAFYLIRISIDNYHKNRGYYAESTSSLLAKIEEVENLPWWSPSKFMYHSEFFLTTLRDKVEFKVVQSIFFALYLVPRDFNYPAYLSRCYERYALKTITRSLLSWIILIFVILVNYLRLLLGYNCTIHGAIHEEHRRSLFAGETSYYHDSEPPEDESVNDSCRKLTMKEFLAVGVMITFYNLCLLVASRVYKLRLVHFVGTQNGQDFREYLEYLKSFEEEHKREIRSTRRFTTRELYQEVTTTLTETEHDDEEHIRFLASLLTNSISAIRNIYSDVKFALRLLFISIFFPKRRQNKKNSNFFNSLKKSKSQETSSLDTKLIENIHSETPSTSTLQRLFSSAEPTPSQHENKTIFIGVHEDASTIAKPASTKENAHNHKEALSGKYRNASQVLGLMRQRQTLQSIKQRVCVGIDSDLPTNSDINNANNGNVKNEAFHPLLSPMKTDSTILNNSANVNDQMHRIDSRHFDDLIGELTDDEERLNADSYSTKASKMKKSKQSQDGKPPSGSMKRKTTGTKATDKSSEIHNSQFYEQCREEWFQEHSFRAKSIRLQLEDSESDSDSTDENETDSMRKESKQQTDNLLLAFQLNSNKNNISGNNLSLPPPIITPNKEGNLMSNTPQNNENNGGSSPMSQSKNTCPVRGFRQLKQQQKPTTPVSSVDRRNSNGSVDRPRLNSLLPSFIENNEETNNDLNNVTNRESNESFVENPMFNLESEALIPEENKVDTNVSAQDQLRSIFLFHRPELFFRAIEIGIMFSCLFMALWVTNMITIVQDIHNENHTYIAVAEIVIILPILLHFKTLPFISQTCALVDAISDLNLLACERVLRDTLDTHKLMKQVRKKVLAHAAEAHETQQSWMNNNTKTEEEVKQKQELEVLVAKLLEFDHTIDRMQRAIAYHSYLVSRLKQRWTKLIQPLAVSRQESPITSQDTVLTENSSQHSNNNNNHVHSNYRNAETKPTSALHVQLQREIHMEHRRLHKLQKKLLVTQNERAKTWSEFEKLKNVVDNRDLENRKRFIDELFEELDQDGSGSIDQIEFRELLRQLSIVLSDHKFRLLFRAIDSKNLDGGIEKDELMDFLFPSASRQLIDYRHYHLDTDNTAAINSQISADLTEDERHIVNEHPRSHSVASHSRRTSLNNRGNRSRRSSHNNHDHSASEASDISDFEY